MANGPLALVDGTSQNRIDLVGQGGLLIRTLPICGPPRCGGIQSAAWSPDGKTIWTEPVERPSWRPVQRR
jgi:hypothetical protein